MLSPARSAQLVAALLEAFKPEDLEKRVLDPLGLRKELRSASRSAEGRVQALVDWAIKEHRVEDLLRAATRANHRNERLQTLSEALGLAPPTSKVIAELGPGIDPKAWQQSLADVRAQVCLVELGSARATGLLIGPDQVLTHVAPFAALPEGPADALSNGRAKVRFEDTPGGRVYASAGVIALLEETGIVVFRLDRQAGRDLESPSFASSARARGWLRLVPAPTPAVGAPVIIVQPGEDGRVSVAVEPDGFLGRDGDAIHYRVGAAPHTAGVPCFDRQWGLIGVHASRDATLGSNDGIALDAILRELNAQGHAWRPSEGLTGAAARPAERTPSLDDVLRAVDTRAPDDENDDEGWGLDARPSEDGWAWAEAAAVVASFVPGQLQPLRPAKEDGRAQLLAASERVGENKDERFALPDGLRAQALARLAQRGELQKARAANRGAPEDLVDTFLGTLIAGTPPQPADLRDPARLRALRQAAGFLNGVVSPLPRLEDLDAALERATLLAPFRHLTQGFFAGREGDLARLKAYVEAPAGRELPRPLLLYGPGGMGKSALVAHFILAHSEGDPRTPGAWRPFVYLDFDRPDLDARDPGSILLAIARQIGPQVPDVAQKARKIVERGRQRRRGESPVPARRTSKKGFVERLSPRTDKAALKALRRDVVGLLRDVSVVLPQPILLVFDTLEEVQYSDADGIEAIVDLAARLRRSVRLLRPVLAGRIEPDSARVKAKLELCPLLPLPLAAREALLANQLPAPLAARTGLVSRMADIVGGNPLSLRLAAEALRREENVEELADTLGDELWERVGDAIVQGRLYERILGHISDREVKAIAYPGLIVRRLTWEVIRDVLAPPSGIAVPDEPAARKLFAKLQSEVALVTQGDAAGVLQLRPELRRTVLDDFRRDTRSQATQQRVHTAAVEFYARRFELGLKLEDRAEEIYHRLALDQDPAEVDRLWLTGLERLLLRSTVDDLASERARAYLSNRLGYVTDAEAMKTANAEEWEAWAERRAGDLLRFRSVARALEVLALRSERLPTSRLHLVESVARRSLSPPDLAGAQSSARRAVEAARKSGDASDLQEALQELVTVSRLADDSATLLKALAELADLGNVLGDDLVLLNSAVEGLESAAAPDDSTFSNTAIEVFARLPDELVARAPELARRVAAQVGGEDPVTLQRVLRLVGTGTLTAGAADSLKLILQGWAERTPDLAAFVPSEHADAREIASAAQYLVANRTLDLGTSAGLTTWLKSVATPGVAGSGAAAPLKLS